MPDTIQKSPIIEVGPISGFPEHSPEVQAIFDGVLEKIEAGYRRTGATRIETPHVERLNVLTAKAGGEVTKEIYALKRARESEGGRATDPLALKFDLTVPLARYVAQHQSLLPFPFRRYQIDKVHRGERPQAGRYREFIQADFDIVGRGSLDVIADAEPPAVINDIFDSMGIGEFVIRLSNRNMLSGLFQNLRLDAAQGKRIMTLIDKRGLGTERLIEELILDVGCSSKDAEQIVDFANLHVDIDAPEDSLGGYCHNEMLEKGASDLATVVQGALHLGVPRERLSIDLSVARGLDYYTGTIYETTLLEHPNLGSICSGGRYDDLASSFSHESFPGVGISIGVSRIVPRLIKSGILSGVRQFEDHVLVTKLTPELMPDYLKMTSKLRRSGVPTEMYFEDKGLGQQIKYAARKGFGYAVIFGPDEKAKDKIILRDLNEGDQFEMTIEQLIAALMPKG